MIQITDKKNCCGCEACVQVCPKHCISFKTDIEGFRYPQVDINKCINCSLCEQVCPELNVLTSRRPQKVYAAKHTNAQIRGTSSSGGIFTLLAEYVFQKQESSLELDIMIIGRLSTTTPKHKTG